jgi:hypothetical protein
MPDLRVPVSPEHGRARIGPIDRRLVDGVHRVVADVGGEPLWFESADVALDDGPEAPASATLLAAASGGQGLSISGPVSRIWLENSSRLLEIAAEWWDLPLVRPEGPTLEQPRERSPGVALCFTGGVDSFHTLLCSRSTPDVLAFVQGYDIALGDHPRMDEWEPAFRDVATRVGSRSVVIRSNLRSHPVHAGRHWPIVHGGALAAVGHLLGEAVGTLLISSGAPASYEVKWGSHWQLDPLWSSDRVSVVHEGGTHSRLSKVRAIVASPLVQRHLRVCWENRSAVGNCSRCDKCVLTMVLVAMCGADDRVEVFDWSGSLAARVDEVPATRFLRTYAEVLEHDVDRRLARAVRSLLQRSGEPGTVPDRWWRRRRSMP